MAGGKVSIPINTAAYTPTFTCGTAVSVDTVECRYYTIFDSIMIIVGRFNVTAKPTTPKSSLGISLPSGYTVGATSAGPYGMYMVPSGDTNFVIRARSDYGVLITYGTGGGYSVDHIETGMNSFFVIIPVVKS